MICNPSRTFKKDVEGVYPILQIEKMKRINAVDIHYSCIEYHNFNKLDIKNKKNKNL